MSFTPGKALIVLLLISISVCAQEGRWDLSYESVLERNNVAKSDWLWTWVKRYKTPAAGWVSGWNGKPIVSSIMIEHPAFHAAEHTTTWLIRTDDEAFYWESIEGNKSDNEEPISPLIYDSIYRQVVSWQQYPPKSAKELPENAFPGYMGFVSHAGPNGSRQMLLTLDDFLICLDKSCLPGKMKSGRLMAALEPILIPESRKNYTHKTEAEIASMTPEQLIDEQIREDENHMMDLVDKQSELIRKYRRLDGQKGLPYLIQLMDGYNPKRQNDIRFFHAMMMANEMDEDVVRLRASAQGRRVIEAVERLAARMRVAGKGESQADATLRQMKGFNFTDEAIGHTLWLRYRITMSDAELVEFSDYLLKHHPTYPSWSKRDLTKVDSPTHDAGTRAQVFILKEPQRYYQAYLAFKKAN